MNAFFPSKSLIATGVACALLAACTVAPTKPDGADELRSRLNQLQSNPELASRAPLAMKEAHQAVTAAEQPQSDKALADHLMFMADRKVSIAQAQAESRLAVDQRKGLSQQREAMRLEARTQEADAANRQSAMDRRDADAARSASADAQLNAIEMQRQIDELQAEVTDRGLVLTLGDVLFSSGTAELNMGGSNNLNSLVAFLNQHSERTVVIEGHTDSIGSESYNQDLSQRRAESVKSYLVRQGIGSNRLTASGHGMHSPIGDNSSATGRQQNRRVEVIIENRIAAAR